MKRAAGFAALALFVGTVFAANYSVQHWGTPGFGGVHTVTVGPWTAPSGVLFVGLAFCLRDFVQSWAGRWWVVAGIICGAAASFAVSTSLATASAAAFLLSETMDFAAYSPLIERGRWVSAVVLSNTVGATVDSVVFLWLAFHSLHFLGGQIALKLLVTLPVLAVLALVRWRRPAVLAVR